MRRIPGRCYYCGDPVCVLSDWFCFAHLWAQDLDLEQNRRLRKRLLDLIAAVRP